MRPACAVHHPLQVCLQQQRCRPRHSSYAKRLRQCSGVAAEEVLELRHQQLRVQAAVRLQVPRRRQIQRLLRHPLSVRAAALRHHHRDLGHPQRRGRGPAARGRARTRRWSRGTVKQRLSRACRFSIGSITRRSRGPRAACPPGSRRKPVSGGSRSRSSAHRRNVELLAVAPCRSSVSSRSSLCLEGKVAGSASCVHQVGERLKPHVPASTPSSSASGANAWTGLLGVLGAAEACVCSAREVAQLAATRRRC